MQHAVQALRNRVLIPFIQRYGRTVDGTTIQAKLLFSAGQAPGCNAAPAGASERCAHLPGGCL